MKNRKNLFFVSTALIIILAGVYTGLRSWTVVSTDDSVQKETRANPDIFDLIASTNLSYATEKTSVPDFTLMSLGGDKVSLSQYQGKVVLISFWATW